MTYKPRRNVSNGRRQDAPAMVDFLVSGFDIDQITPQDKGRIADKIGVHYRSLSRGQINRMIAQALRRAGK